MKHAEFKTNKLTTAACTNKADNDKASEKGFTRGGSDGVDHVAREVLQHGVANRGSRVLRTNLESVRPSRSTEVLLEFPLICSDFLICYTFFRLANILYVHANENGVGTRD